MTRLEPRGPAVAQARGPRKAAFFTDLCALPGNKPPFAPYLGRIGQKPIANSPRRLKFCVDHVSFRRTRQEIRSKLP